MKIKNLGVAVIMVFWAWKSMAAIHYVVPPGTVGVTPADPYTNWATAGTSIIDVVNAAATSSAPRLVWVTNGVYYPTNVINVSAKLTLQSVNGRDATILNGNKEVNTNRCALFSVSASIFDGFTVTNYVVTNGHGVIYGADNLSVFNCLFVGNSSRVKITGTGSGGALYLAKSGVMSNCIFQDNYSDRYGGAIYATSITNLTIAGCRFEGNRCDYYGGGGFALEGNNCTVSNCTIINNACIGTIAGHGGGGGYLTGTNNKILNCSITGNVVNALGNRTGGGLKCSGEATIRDCSIIGNVCSNKGGGVQGDVLAIRNCLIALNQATTNIGGGVYLTNGIVESCTIVGNYAAVAGGGVYIDGSGSGTNNIIYFNMAGVSASNFTNTAGNTGLNYSCVIPAVDGMGNITNNPVLKNLAGGDYRLRMTSPCVNTGTNQSWMTGAADLEGNPRILKTIVDMGAYETRIWQGTIFSVHGR